MKFKVEKIRGISMHLTDDASLEGCRSVYHPLSTNLAEAVKEWVTKNLNKTELSYSVKTWILSSNSSKQDVSVVSVIVRYVDADCKEKSVKGTIVVSFKYSLIERIKRWFTKKYNNFVDRLANM